VRWVMVVVSFCVLRSSDLIADPIGETSRVGSTAWDFHGTGSLGRMTAFASETLFFSWTCVNQEFPLGINFNAYYPSGVWLADSSGLRISAPSFTARFVDMAMIEMAPGGPRVPIMVYKRRGQPLIVITKYSFGDTIHTYLNHGMFFDMPHIAVDTADQVHLLLLDSEITGGPYYLFYERSEDRGENFGPLELLDSTFTASHLAISSRYGPRSAVIYARPLTYEYQAIDYHNNDLFVVTSSNGTDWSWAQPLNLTRFVDADTFRMGFDVSALFDTNDLLHVTFPTIGYFYAVPHDSVHILMNSLLWHWSEAQDTFTVVAKGWNDSQPGVWHHSADKASLAYDQATGYLYCVYEKFTLDDMSAEEFSNGEIWATVSTDGGVNWSEGVNITNTPSPGCPPGQCASEVFPSAAEVVNDTLHVFYCLDRAAGAAAFENWPEGTLTNNPMIYQKVPCDLIPTTPLILQDISLHVGQNNAKEFGNVKSDAVTIDLVYPNPFNNAAIITITLQESDKLCLEIFDINGRKVADLFDGYLVYGRYQFEWNCARQNGKEVTSGQYFIVAKTSRADFVGRILLIK
jgi:hypothetical protein